jgi:hypothetical protein
MNPRAQAGLEYLLTYGWALVLVATIVGVFVMLIGTPAQAPVFNSSDLAKFPVRGGTIDNSTQNKASVIVKNVTGGKISITNITLRSSFTGCSSSCKFNGTVFNPTFPGAVSFDVIAGGDLRFDDIAYSGTGTGVILVKYKDYAGFMRDLNISGRKGAG